MKMSVSDLENGMVLEEDVFTKNGNFVLLSAGMKLSSLLINRLIDAGIREVKIVSKKTEKDKNTEKLEVKLDVKKFGQPEIKENLDQGFEKVTDSIKKVMSSKNIKGDKVIAFARKLINFIDSSFSEHILYVLEGIAGNENKDEEVFVHMTNVAVLSHTIGKWLKYDKEKLDKLTMAALFHDIGMLKINDVLLNKNDKLTYYEHRDIRKHCRYARDILREWDFDEEIIEGVFQHHERLDGSGYPLHLKGNNINEISKIIAVADVFDALTSHKPHRDSFTILEALRELEEESLNQLDTKITKLFVTKFFENYLGQGVELTNRKKGKIIRLNSNKITRPLVACTDGAIFDLASDKSISIKNFL